MKNSKNILFILLLALSVLSCTKDEGTSAAEQSVIDNKIIVDYLNTHKIDSTATHPPNHINWTIISANDGDETLADIAVKDSSTTGGVVYYYYYIEIKEGKNIEGEGSNDLIVVDFNEFLLDNTRLSTSENDVDALELEINTRISGVKIGLKHFFTGILSADNIEPNYRVDTDVPGRGILIFPSGLGYKDIGNEKIAPNQPLRVDLVLYTKTNFPEEEK